MSSLQGTKSQRSFLCMHELELQNSILQIKMLPVSGNVHEEKKKSEFGSIALSLPAWAAAVMEMCSAGLSTLQTCTQAVMLGLLTSCTFTSLVLSQRKQQAQGKASTHCRIHEAWGMILTCLMPS